MMYEVGDLFKLKASYCSDNEHCCDDDPCIECLDMCNIYCISSVHKTVNGYDYFFGGTWANITGGRILDTPICSVMTTDSDKADGFEILHINETIKLVSGNMKFEYEIILNGIRETDSIIYKVPVSKGDTIYDKDGIMYKVMSVVHNTLISTIIADNGE